MRACAALASFPLSGALDAYRRRERCGRRAAAKTLSAVSSHRRPEMDFGRVLLTGLSWSQRNPVGPRGSEPHSPPTPHTHTHTRRKTKTDVRLFQGSYPTFEHSNLPPHHHHYYHAHPHPPSKPPKKGKKIKPPIPSVCLRQPAASAQWGQMAQSSDGGQAASPATCHHPAPTGHRAAA